MPPLRRRKEAYLRAQRVLTAFDEARQAGKGAIMFEGTMLGPSDCRARAPDRRPGLSAHR